MVAKIVKTKLLLQDLVKERRNSLHVLQALQFHNISFVMRSKIVEINLMNLIALQVNQTYELSLYVGGRGTFYDSVRAAPEYQGHKNSFMFLE